MTNGNGDFHDHSDGICVRIEEEIFDLTIDIIPFNLKSAAELPPANPCYELKWNISLFRGDSKSCLTFMPEDKCEMNIFQGGALKASGFNVWINVYASKYTDTGGCTKTIETELGKSKVDTCDEKKWGPIIHRANGSISVCPGSKLWPHDKEITDLLVDGFLQGTLRDDDIVPRRGHGRRRIRIKDIVPSEMEGLLTKLLKGQFDKDGKLTDGWLMDLIKDHTMPRGKIADGLLACWLGLESCCKLKKP